MQNEMTIEAAIIELNRLKAQERMDIDRERLTAAIDVLKDAAQFRIKRKPMKQKFGYVGAPWIGYNCAQCNAIVDGYQSFCDACGQALDWSD